MYRAYIQMLTDALAVGDIDYPAYRVLKDAADRLHRLRTEQTQQQPPRVRHPNTS